MATISCEAEREEVRKVNDAYKAPESHNPFFRVAYSLLRRAIKADDALADCMSREANKPQ